MLTKNSWLVIVALALVGPGCGGKVGGDVGPCEADDPAAQCGAECAITDDCEDGFFCQLDGTCYAECTADNTGCGDGYVCDENGRCQTEEPTNCPSIMVSAEPVVPTVQLLIDQSGSMVENFNGPTRWEAVQQALADPQNGVVVQRQDRVIFGATLYSSNGVPGTCPILQEVAPALNNFTAIADLVNSNDPANHTPTAESVTAVAATFPAADGPRIIVLATDGDPDNCVDPDAHNLESQQMSEAAVQAAYELGIETVVLSVGDDVSVPHLQKLANAGKGQDLDTGMEPFYVANSPAELVAAFDDIIRGARTCSFTLDSEVVDATGGTVTLNGMDLEYERDWILRDSRTLELIGSACDTFLNEDVVELTALFNCGAVIIVE